MDKNLTSHASYVTGNLRLSHEKIAANFEQVEGDFPRQATEKKVTAIRAINASKDRPKLLRIAGLWFGWTGEVRQTIRK